MCVSGSASVCVCVCVCECVHVSREAQRFKLLLSARVPLFFLSLWGFGSVTDSHIVCELDQSGSRGCGRERQRNRERERGRKRGRKRQRMRKTNLDSVYPVLMWVTVNAQCLAFQ